jgi:hypothetical protein
MDSHEDAIARIDARTDADLQLVLGERAADLPSILSSVSGDQQYTAVYTASGKATKARYDPFQKLLGPPPPPSEPCDTKNPVFSRHEPLGPYNRSSL